MTEQIEQWICIKFCIEHSSVETIWMIKKSTAMGNWRLAASSRQHTHSCITSRTVFWQNIKSPRWISPSYSSVFTSCDFWLFRKLKSPLKGKRFQTIDEIQENMTEAADGDWETCLSSQGAHCEGDWGVIVLCSMSLVSCIFFNKWLYVSYYMAGYVLDGPRMSKLEIGSLNPILATARLITPATIQILTGIPFFKKCQ